MGNEPSLREELRVLRRAVPGALVLVVVLLLLRGYDGTIYVLSRQVSMLAESFLGGPDVVVPVLLHTLPLALAAGVATFAVSAGWIRFESVWSVIVLSGIILAGTTIGGLLRTLVPAAETESKQPAAIASSQARTTGLTIPSAAIHSAAIPSAAVTSAAIPSAAVTSGKLIEPTSVIPAAQTVVLSVTPSESASGLAVNTSSLLSDVSTIHRPGPLQRTAQPTAWEQLRQIDFFAAPNLAQPPPTEIEPINVVPKISGILNVVGLAINQLLGFLVAYQPRLFLAAVIAGGWTGWRWQQRLQTVREQVEQEFSGEPDTVSTRRAA